MTPTRVAIDLTPLVDEPTGVARSISGVLPHLAHVDDLDVRGWVLSARAAEPSMPQSLPTIPVDRVRVPARVVHRIWAAGRRVPFATWRDADVVHGTNFAAPPSPTSLLTVHDLTPFEEPHVSPTVRGRARVIRRAAARGAWFHVPTEHVRGRVIDALAVDPARVHAIPHGLDPVPAADPVMGRDLAGSERYVLSLGTTHRRKNLPRLMAAMERIDPEVGLVIAGAAGTDEDAVRRTLEALDNGRTVRRITSVNEARRAQLLRGASVLAYPSLDEGFGFPPLEAMSVGVAVVAGAAGSIPEVVDDGAVLVDPTDADAIADALAIALDPRRAAAVIARGRRVAARYRWDVAAARLGDLYRTVATA